MPMIPPKTASKTAFELCPAGPQQLVCCDLVDHGLVRNAWGGKERVQHKVSLRWQSIHKMKDGRPYLVQKRYTFSLHAKATLRKDIDAWRGLPLTDDQAATFDLERLLGVNCFANVVHMKKPRGVFAEVVSLMPLPKQLPKIAIEAQYVRVCNRKPGEQHDDGPPPSDAGEAWENGQGDSTFSTADDEPEF